MTAAVALTTASRSDGDGRRVRGRASIDSRPPVPCTLAIQGDGTWSAELATFTLAGEVVDPPSLEQCEVAE